MTESVQPASQEEHAGPIPLAAAPAGKSDLALVLAGAVARTALFLGLLVLVVVPFLLFSGVAVEKLIERLDAGSPEKMLSMVFLDLMVAEHVLWLIVGIGSFFL